MTCQRVPMRDMTCQRVPMRDMTCQRVPMRDKVCQREKRANEKYRKEKVKQVVVRFYPADTDAYAWLKSKENASGYLKDLIRRDMEGRA